MSQRYLRGFTLIELLVVLAILGIIVSVAVPSYREYVLRTNRTDAKNSLVDLAARQERFRFNNNAYATSVSQLGASPTSVEGKYALALNATATSFTVRATPVGTQINDRCGALTITNTGQKGVVNSNGLSAQECWR